MNPSAHELSGVDRFTDVLNRGFSVVFRHWIAVASVWALVTVGGALLTPWLASRGFGTAAQLLYWAYRPLCPQRPDHSFFIAGHKMAFEQRETAMFVAGAVAGPVYVLLRRACIRVPGRLAIAAVVPMFVDVATQVVGLRESDGFWRFLTGALAALAAAAWVYPKLDADFSSPMIVRSTETTE